MGYGISNCSGGMVRPPVCEMMKLSYTEKEMYDCLASRGQNVDVSILEIHKSVYMEELGARKMQQRIGAVVSRINRKMESCTPVAGRIVPGERKRTYRLTR